MSNAAALALSILTALDVAVLRRTGEREYAVVGEPPVFYSRLFPGRGAAPCATPWRHSDMLAFFLDEAEFFFAQEQPGFVSSGIWQEEGVQTGRKALMAEAICLDAAQVLVIRLLRDEFVDRTRVLQTAREQLLEQRRAPAPRHPAGPREAKALRKAFLTVLQEHIDRSIKENSELSLLLMAVDDFENVRALHGESKAAALLDAMHGLLQGFLRHGDAAKLYGLSTFGIFAPRTMQHQAIRMAEKLRKTVAGFNFATLPPITVSIGCSTYHKGEAGTELLQRAFKALEDADEDGRNTLRMR